VQQFLVAGAVDATQQEEFAAASTQQKGDQAAERRADCGQQYVQVEVSLVVP
jgi:hypothetical protein